MNVYIPFVGICIGIVGFLAALFLLAGFVTLSGYGVAPFDSDSVGWAGGASLLAGIVLSLIAIGAGLS